MTNKTAILIDTNVFLTNWNVIFQQDKNDVIVPYKVLEELDKHKKRQDSLGNNARNIIRFFDELRSKGDLVNGVQIREDCGMLFCKGVSNINILPAEYEHNNPDNQILAVALEIFHHKKNVTVLSQDINLRIKCAALGIPTDDYREDNIIVEKTELYRGWREYKLDDDFINRFYAGEEMFIEDSSLFPNEFLILKSETNNQKSALCRWVNKGIPLRKVPSSFPNDWGFVANNKEQLFALDLLFDPDVPIVSLAGPAGCGKAQPNDSKILSNKGWIRMKNVRIGDILYDGDGKETKVLGVFPQGEKDIYRVFFTDDTYTDCCEEHLWMTKTSRERDEGKLGKIRSTREIKESLRYGTSNKRNHSIPIIKPVEFEKKELPIEPYFFGCLLGDGSFRNHLGFSCGDEQIIQEIQNIIKKDNYYIEKKKNREFDYKIKEKSRKNRNIYKNILFNLGLWNKYSNEKFIPPIFLFSSIEDRISLLQGLMDTDGTIDKRGYNLTFTTTSLQMSKDFIHLIQSLGGTAKTTSRITKFNYKGIKKDGKISYRTTVVLPNDIIPFRLDRKKKIIKKREKYFPRRYIDKIELIGKKEATCILVDNKDHLYTTNDFIITHNTVLATIAGLSQVDLTYQNVSKKVKQTKIGNKQYKKLLISRPIMPMGKDIGYLPGPLPSETDILTPNGWKKLSQLSVGDFVIGKNGKSVKINHIFEKGKKEKIKISFQDGTSAECCEDHLWQVYKPSCDVSYTISTKDLEERYKVDIKKKWWQRLFIDLVEPVEYETKQEITINPYVLGCILGDGCITAKYTNEFSCNELELVERINSYLPENIILKYKSGRTYTFTMKENIGNVKRKANIMTEQINNLGLRGKSSRTKFIPRKYLFSSVEDRILLLQGLMDTDGYVSKDGSDVSYTTTSKQLAEDFKELVLSLGGLANIKFSEKKFNSYTISVSFHKNIIPFSLLGKIKRYKHRRNICKRRIEKIERTGIYVDMKCININSEDGLFVINDFIVTHNSKQEKLDPWIAPIRDNMAFLFGGDEYHIDEYIERKIIEIEAPTYIRGRSIQNAYMLLDETQNLNRNEMKTIMTRVGYNTKIVLTGDLSQIDNINLDEYSSGLTHLIERLKHSQLSGHVYLDQGERSEVATLCAEKL